MAGAAGVLSIRGSDRDWASLVEGVLLFTLILFYIWWIRDDLPRFWIALLAGVIVLHAVHGDTTHELGFGTREFRAALPVVLPWVLNLGMGIWGLGILLDTVRSSTFSYVFQGLATYIAWGTFQQYLLNSYFVNRLADFTGDPQEDTVGVIAAVLFAGVHTPNWFLMAVTLPSGYVCAKLFLRYRSVPALGIAHGVLGFALQMVVPDSIIGHLLVGPRYWMQG